MRAIVDSVWNASPEQISQFLFAFIVGSIVGLAIVFFAIYKGWLAKFFDYIFGKL